ncbi:MAG: helix-turn-helix domain-containing protein [Acidobacteriaceae bacterium]
MSKHGRRLRLPGQPFQILLMLLESGGELVTRDEIRQRLWPDGTFVDFDHSLNSAVNKLRDTLSDSAAQPRYIETLARRGYRFLAPVEAVAAAVTTPSAPVPGVQPPPPSRTLLTSQQDLPQASKPLVRILLLLAQLMYLGFYIGALANLAEIQQLLISLTDWSSQLLITLIATAALGIAIRLFLLSAAGFRAPGFKRKYLRLFPLLFLLDCAWALAPFLMMRHIGFGLAFAATAALLLVPFAQRTLVLMSSLD